MPAVKHKFPLRKIQDASDINEHLVNRILSGKIQPKYADSANTVIKNFIKLNVDFPFKYAAMVNKMKGQPLHMDVPLIKEEIERQETKAGENEAEK